MLRGYAGLTSRSSTLSFTLAPSLRPSTSTYSLETSIFRELVEPKPKPMWLQRSASGLGDSTVSKDGSVGSRSQSEGMTSDLGGMGFSGRSKDNMFWSKQVRFSDAHVVVQNRYRHSQICCSSWSRLKASHNGSSCFAAHLPLGSVACDVFVEFFTDSAAIYTTS